MNTLILTRFHPAVFPWDHNCVDRYTKFTAEILFFLFSIEIFYKNENITVIFIDVILRGIFICGFSLLKRNTLSGGGIAPIFLLIPLVCHSAQYWKVHTVFQSLYIRRNVMTAATLSFIDNFLTYDIVSLKF